MRISRRSLLYDALGFPLLPSVLRASRDFNGTTDFINAGDGAAFRDLANLTVSCWFAADNAGENSLGRICDKTDGWFINLTTVGGATRGAFTVRFSGVPTTMNKIVNFGWSAGVWRHVAVTWDGTNLAAGINIYINGTLAAPASTQNAGGARLADSDLYIGNIVTNDRSWNGKLAFFSVYNRILTVGEINQLIYKPSKILVGCVGHWPLYGADSPEPDFSGNANSGVVNAPVIGTTNPPVGASYL